MIDIKKDSIIIPPLGYWNNEPYWDIPKNENAKSLPKNAYWKTLIGHPNDEKEYMFLKPEIAPTEKIKNFQCKKCDKKFQDKQKLSYHLIAVHQNSKSFKCEKCSFRANFKFNLNKHFKAVHLKEKYHCKKCGKGYANIWYGQKHEEVCEK